MNITVIKMNLTVIKMNTNIFLYCDVMSTIFLSNGMFFTIRFKRIYFLQRNITYFSPKKITIKSYRNILYNGMTVWTVDDENFSLWSLFWVVLIAEFYCIFQIIAAESQEDILLAVVNKEKLVRLMEHVLDERKFLSPYGIRSLSKARLYLRKCL